MGLGHTHTDILEYNTKCILPNEYILSFQKNDQNKQETGDAHQFHAELMGFVLGMGVRRQREAAPPVWSELLLLQLGIQASGERHLEMNTHTVWCQVTV